MTRITLVLLYLALSLPLPLVADGAWRPVLALTVGFGLLLVAVLL